MSKVKEAPEAVAALEKEKPRTAAPAKPKKGDLMYLGPTIVGAARHGTVFKDGILPKRAQECIGEVPQMSRLFIEMDRVPEAVKELRNKQGVLSAIHDLVESHFSTQKSMRRI